MDRARASAGPPRSSGFARSSFLRTPARRLDQLVGTERWAIPDSFGSTVVRFPSSKPPWDDGWHIDASFPPNGDPQSTDYLQWRVNYTSRDRAMLVLFLFSDCGPDDAPTRVRVGSHLPMARQLQRHGEVVSPSIDLANEGFDSSADCEVALATGEAGTVWLLHLHRPRSASPSRTASASSLNPASASASKPDWNAPMATTRQSNRQ